MSESNPWFKFYPGLYLAKRITMCDLQTQGLFMNISCHYWINDCSMCLADAKERFIGQIKQLDRLLKLKIIKVDEQDFIHIEFLDEQFEFRKYLIEQKIEAGRKGGLARAKQLPSGCLAKEKEKEREKESKNESKKKRYIDNDTQEVMNGEWRIPNPTGLPGEQTSQANTIYFNMLSTQAELSLDLDFEKLKSLAARFVTYYQKLDWCHKDGNPIKDWRDLVRDWIIKDADKLRRSDAKK